MSNNIKAGVSDSAVAAANEEKGVQRVTKELMEKEYIPTSETNMCLSTALYKIHRDKPFLGTILQLLHITYTHSMPTAGVSFNVEHKRWDLFINPYFFCRKLTSHEQRIAVLLHELYHITNRHPQRVPFIKLTPFKRQLMNIAADMAINQFILNLPDGCDECRGKPADYQCQNKECVKCIDVKNFYLEDDKGKKTYFEKNQTTEKYYDLLLRKMQDPEEGNGGGDSEGEGFGSKGGKGMPKPMDEHNWDASGEEKDMLEATEDLVKRAMVKERMSYDQLEGSFKELLMDIKARRAELDYRSLILMAIKKSASGHERKNTWTRKSKRFGEKAPGTTVGNLPKLNFYIDTSGSISIEEANEFLAIADQFLKTGCRKCRLNLFHTKNYFSQEYSLGRRIKREEFESGGTDLEDSFKDIYKRKPNLAICVTDGFYDNVEVEKWLKANDKFPQVLFIISKDGTEDHPLKRLGKTVKIPNGAKR